MFPCTVKYTESEYDIQNNDSLNQINQQCKKHFRNVGSVRNIKNKKRTFFILYYL